MSHFDVTIVTATKVNACEVCGGPIHPGDRIEFHRGPPRGVKHIACGLAERRTRP